MYTVQDLRNGNILLTVTKDRRQYPLVCSQYQVEKEVRRLEREGYKPSGRMALKVSASVKQGKFPF